MAVKIDSRHIVSSEEFKDAVWNAVLNLYGEYGASRSDLRLISYDAERKFAVIRTLHTTVELTRTALASVTEIRDNKAALHVLTISGTIKTLRRKTKL